MEIYVYRGAESLGTFTLTGFGLTHPFPPVWFTHRQRIGKEVGHQRGRVGRVWGMKEMVLLDCLVLVGGCVSAPHNHDHDHNKDGHHDPFHAHDSKGNIIPVPSLPPPNRRNEGDDERG